MDQTDNPTPTPQDDSARYQVDLPMFQGPLDLLLHLIEQEELDITRVALAQVTDQYLAYLAVLQEVEAEFLTDFLVIAAKLLLIKSQALLPKPPPGLAAAEEEDLGEQLARQLLAYKRYKAAAQTLRQREEAGLRTFVRVAPPPKIEPRLSLDDVSLDDLLVAVQQALAIQPADAPVDEVVSPVTVTIGQQMTLIQEELTAQQEISFTGLLRRASSRLEIIVTLLAVLELIKQYAIDVRQEVPFGEIVIFSKGEDGTRGIPGNSDIPQAS